MLHEAEKDERLWYKPADVFINAPLALIQVELKAVCRTLRDVLGLDQIPYCTGTNPNTKAA